MSVWDQLARKIVSVARAQARTSPQSRRFKVTGTDPLRATALHSDLAISEDDEDVEVTQSVLDYHERIGIEKDDVVTVREDGQDFTIHDVVSDKAVT